MPTENERKYVLDLKFAEDINQVKSILGHTLKSGRKIRQAYLYGDPIWNLRVRQKEQSDGTMIHWCCLKYNIGERVVELEQEISERDFEDLWSHAIRHLTKYRYDLFPDDDIKWEIDLFYDDDGQLYFIEAEHEMPENQKLPNFIPFIIRKYLLYAVPPAEQFQFSSFNLADPEWSKGVYQLARQWFEEFGNQLPEPQSVEPLE